MIRFLPIISFVLLLPPSLVRAQEAVDFVREVQPVLEKNCVKCHGPEEQNGGIRFDQRAGALAETDSGLFAIVPGDPDKSGMLRRVVSHDLDERMPPKGEALTAAEVAVLTRWISNGAPWPAEAGKASPAAAKEQVKSTHWSFQPIGDPVPPAVKDESWPRNGIDRFLLSKREAAGLPTVPDAEPAVLLRRASYALTGLPPTAQQVREFSMAAFAREVDRMLDSPQYGERQARHWLDWARYADTAGDNSDFPIPQAWLYRKYVIDAFNADLPYDRFLTEQLAGDLLPAATQEEKNRQTIATGYLAGARRFGSLVETYPQHLTIEDTLDNLGRTMLGLTLSCARCHDHKFDPVSTRDYYGLYGIFESTRYPFPGIELFQMQWNFVPLVSDDEVEEKTGAFKEETARLEAKLETSLAAARAFELEMARTASKDSLEAQRSKTAQRVRLLAAARSDGEKLAKHLKKIPVIPTAYAVQEGRPGDARIQLKGEPDRPGAEVPRKFPDILGGHQLPPDAARGSGRLELAKWMTSPDNPLTARVIVNRVWQRHFGRGLVPSTSDFGLRGEKPVHPELLDWLAREFMKNGWSFKWLHRLILNSRTWQLSSQDDAAGLAADPENRMWWKFPRQRLDAESMRDTLLFVSGTLDAAPQSEPYPMPPGRDWEYTQHHPFKADYPSNKRTIYQMTRRLTAQPWLQTFDGPDANVCTSTRDTSVTALQALYFVNDPFLHGQAQRLAEKLIREQETPGARLEAAFLSVLARAPHPEERQAFLGQLDLIRPKVANETEAWASLMRVLFRLNEFLYPD